MVNKFQKGDVSALSDHFNLGEFHCKCLYPDCTYTLVDTDLVEALEELRNSVGPLHINDGYRCSRHNDNVGGKPGSYHLVGKAADLTSHVPLSSLYFAALSVPRFDHGGIGRYGNFIHVDVRGYTARWEG